MFTRAASIKTNLFDSFANLDAATVPFFNANIDHITNLSFFQPYRDSHPHIDTIPV
jgi:hypothetical protein